MLSATHPGECASNPQSLARSQHSVHIAEEINGKRYISPVQGKSWESAPAPRWGLLKGRSAPFCHHHSRNLELPVWLVRGFFLEGLGKDGQIDD